MHLIFEGERAFQCCQTLKLYRKTNLYFALLPEEYLGLKRIVVNPIKLIFLLLFLIFHTIPGYSPLFLLKWTYGKIRKKLNGGQILFGVLYLVINRP